TAIARMPFSLEDRVRTDQKRELARQRTPRVYVPSLTAIEAIGVSIENLPRTLAAVDQLEQVTPELRRQLSLTPESFADIRRFVVEGEVAPAWRERSAALIEQLLRRPVVDAATYQRETQESTASQIEIRVPGQGPVQMERRNLVNI